MPSLVVGEAVLAVHVLVGGLAPLDEPEVEPAQGSDGVAHHECEDQQHQRHPLHFLEHQHDVVAEILSASLLPLPIAYLVCVVSVRGEVHVDDGDKGAGERVDGERPDGDDKEGEVGVVAAGHAGTHPGAVVVELVHAVVAAAAVFRPFWSVDVAGITKAVPLRCELLLRDRGRDIHGW
eukprot:CAMPEP_0113953326 /NCGR_PEP_ID=MMETSP1339-20121228/90919_1 /TAXON_ID=94617 /ORGANISM="Fibrocapsa japonica" /LENGTH=178 /DNA_ID=CAMNT_0000962049 /DNA_START=300 /DNA_END=833 /DNA_ORIENTATION=+ /assembly_acc=CAM_ASM_000762